MRERINYPSLLAGCAVGGGRENSQCEFEGLRGQGSASTDGLEAQADPSRDPCQFPGQSARQLDGHATHSPDAVLRPAPTRRRSSSANHRPNGSTLSPGLPNAQKPPRTIPAWVWLLVILAVAAFLRLYALDRLGFNSDEAVYAGQGGVDLGCEGVSQLLPDLPSSPIALSVGRVDRVPVRSQRLRRGVVAVLFGLGTIVVCYHLGALLYDRRTGLLAAGHPRSHAVSRHREPAGVARRPGGVLHDARPVRAREVPDQRRRTMAVRARRHVGARLPHEGDRARHAGRGVHLLRARRRGASDAARRHAERRPFRWPRVRIPGRNGVRRCIQVGEVVLPVAAAP